MHSVSIKGLMSQTMIIIYRQGICDVYTEMSRPSLRTKRAAKTIYPVNNLIEI